MIVLRPRKKESHYGRFKVKWDSDQEESYHSSWDLIPDLDAGKLLNIGYVT